jgi:chromosome partitioning protein
MLTVVGNLKGGTGKSTVVFNLALWLLRNRTRVLAVDLDPQGTLADVVQVRCDEGDEPQVELTRSLADALARAKDYDEILIDVGPSDLASMYAAILAADRLLIPVPPSQADVWSTQRFVRKVIESRGSKNKPECLAFINRADTHQAVRESDETFGALGMIEGLRVLRPRLGQRMAFRRSFSEGLSVHELEVRSKATLELDALAQAVFQRARRGGQKR